MCNSYNNGHCNYYGVDVMELNYKCERGECMTIIVKCDGCGTLEEIKLLSHCDIDDYKKHDSDKFEIIKHHDGCETAGEVHCWICGHRGYL